jgi:hypothetical protein
MVYTSISTSDVKYLRALTIKTKKQLEENQILNLRWCRYNGRC